VGLNSAVPSGRGIFRSGPGDKSPGYFHLSRWDIRQAIGKLRCFNTAFDRTPIPGAFNLRATPTNSPMNSPLASWDGTPNLQRN